MSKDRERKMLEFGAAVRAARAAKNLSSRQLANRMGISRADYLLLEEGSVCPTAQQFKRLLNSLPAVAHYEDVLRDERARDAQVPAPLPANRMGRRVELQQGRAEYWEKKQKAEEAAHAALPRPKAAVPVSAPPLSLPDWGRALRAAREEEGFSQVELAVLLDAERGVIFRLESGAARPDRALAERVYKLFGEDFPRLEAAALRESATGSLSLAPVTEDKEESVPAAQANTSASERKRFLETVGREIFAFRQKYGISRAGLSALLGEHPSLIQRVEKGVGSLEAAEKVRGRCSPEVLRANLPPTAPDLVAAVKRACEMRGRDRVAGACGVPVERVQAWEGGIMVPTATEFRRLKTFCPAIPVPAGGVGETPRVTVPTAAPGALSLGDALALVRQIEAAGLSATLQGLLTDEALSLAELERSATALEALLRPEAVEALRAVRRLLAGGVRPDELARLLAPRE